MPTSPTSLMELHAEIQAAFQFADPSARAEASRRMLFREGVLKQISGSRDPILIANASVAATTLPPAERRRALEGILTLPALGAVAASRDENVIDSVARSAAQSNDAKFVGGVISLASQRLDAWFGRIALDRLLEPPVLDMLAASGDAHAIARTTRALAGVPQPHRHRGWERLMTPQAMGTLAMSPNADFLAHMASDMAESGGAALLERLKQGAGTLDAERRNQVLQRLSVPDVAPRPHVLPALHPQGRHVSGPPSSAPSWQDIVTRPAGRGAQPRDAHQPRRGGPDVR
ncbi:hypothetical protein [Hydrogenophaga sp.]|uniref:hypothetical protein n=1 Tax=Hydrogenophaga sp. TaxID=1904254 RepID=UPI003F72FE89